MRSKLFLTGVLAGVIALSMTNISRAEENAAPAAQAPVEVGNKICPISGEALMEGQEAKVEYNGKIYNLCCAACTKDFLKDPEAAIKKLEAAEGEDHSGHVH